MTNKPTKAKSPFSKVQSKSKAKPLPDYWMNDLIELNSMEKAFSGKLTDFCDSLDDLDFDLTKL